MDSCHKDSYSSMMTCYNFITPLVFVKSGKTYILRPGPQRQDEVLSYGRQVSKLVEGSFVFTSWPERLFIDQIMTSKQTISMALFIAS